MLDGGFIIANLYSIVAGFNKLAARLVTCEDWFKILRFIIVFLIVITVIDDIYNLTCSYNS